MGLLDRVNGSSGLKAIIGSGCFWAWFDALFMSAFFRSSSHHAMMPEACAILTFALSIPFLAASFLRSDDAKRLLSERRWLAALGGIGSFGSALVVLAGLLDNWLLLAFGTLLGGAFMAMYGLAWGAVYCRGGARTANLYVAGGFACALAIDVPLLLMIPAASEAFFALLPFASSIFLTAIPALDRTYPSDTTTPDQPLKSSRSLLKNYLGLSLMLVGGMILVMIGFGYFQHLVSFASIAGTDQTDGVSIQLARGGIALVLFALMAIARRSAVPAFRVGLLAMTAGFTMMPFLFDFDLFWLAGVLIIGGYTVFDLLVWITFSQVARTQSRDPFKTIAVMRAIVGSCFALGALLGLFLVGSGDGRQEFAAIETAAVGYLVVIATVLLLSSEDVWALSRSPRPLRPSSADDENEGRDTRLGRWFDSFELTAREREIALLLTYGRTKSWIAQSLCISENTVVSHVRHIYRKADVHNRQQFVDLVFSDASPDSCDR